jgi:putative hydrolase
MVIFKKYNEIDSSYLLTDKHLHSTWTDGKATVLQIAERAKSLGLKHIAITDHIRESSDYFDDYYSEIRNVSHDLNFEIYAGFEAKILNFHGDIDVCNAVYEKADLRIASVHRFPIGRKLFGPKYFNRDIWQAIELELSISAIRGKKMDVLGHPGGMSLRYFGDFPLDYFEEIIFECQKYGIAFDLDFSYHHPIIQKLKPLLAKLNPLISLGSDAHKLEDIGKWKNVVHIMNEIQPTEIG